MVSKTLEMMIMEITRLYTPGNAFRLVKTPFQLASDPSKVIPIGSVIGINGALLGRQSAAYPDPCKFYPHRYDLASSSKDDSTRSSDNFFGIGFGAHPCVGRRLSISEISIFVAEALQTFEFELVDTVFAETTITTNNNGNDAAAMTRRLISNVPNHPILDPAQPGCICWRPIHPVMIKYKRTNAA
jgi:cytochrome P450